MISHTIHDGVLFYEGAPVAFDEIAPVHVELGGMLISQSQLKSLRDVKTEMALRVKQLGGNAVVHFKYGQKSVGFWRSLLQIDDVNWYGSGTVATVRL